MIYAIPVFSTYSVILGEVIRHLLKVWVASGEIFLLLNWNYWTETGDLNMTTNWWVSEIKEYFATS